MFTYISDNKRSPTEVMKINPKYRMEEGVSQPAYRYVIFPYQTCLDVTETDQYVHPSAHAHTIPKERIICIRPREKLPYALRDVIFAHEVAHNVFPGERNEDMVTRLGPEAVGKNRFKFRYTKN